MITENASVLPGDGGWMIDHPADCLDIDGNQLRPAWFRDEEDATSYLSWLAEYGLPVRSGGYLAGNVTDEQDHRMVFEGWGVWEADGSACGPLQIQRYDTLESGLKPLPSDECAWELVVHEARAGSWLHRLALLDVVLLNTDPSTPYLIRRGDRIGQLLTLRTDSLTIDEVLSLSESDRGSTGFGDSGR